MAMFESLCSRLVTFPGIAFIFKPRGWVRNFETSVVHFQPEATRATRKLLAESVNVNRDTAAGLRAGDDLEECYDQAG